jgi:hypothetical protein
MSVEIPLTDPESIGSVGGKALHDFYNYALRTTYITLEEENYEGYRVNYDEAHGNGWALLRTSQNATMLSINLESDSEHGAIKIAKDLYYFLKKSPFVDTSLLKEAINTERARLIANIRKDFYSNTTYLNFLFGEKIIVQADEIAQAEEAEEPANENASVATEALSSANAIENNI